MGGILHFLQVSGSLWAASALLVEEEMPPPVGHPSPGSSGQGAWLLEMAGTVKGSSERKQSAPCLFPVQSLEEIFLF